MKTVCFIGDEITAAGFRLSGAETRVPAPGRAAASLAAALDDAELVLISAASAAELEAGELDRAVRAASPLVLVVPDTVSADTPPDLGEAVDRVLGIAS